MPQVKPHWFWGNRPSFSKNLKDIILDHYNALGENKFGLYWYLNEATIFIKDRDLIKRIQIVDFDHFTDLGNTHSDNALSLIFSLIGVAQIIYICVVIRIM